MADNKGAPTEVAAWTLGKLPPWRRGLPSSSYADSLIQLQDANATGTRPSSVLGRFRRGVMEATQSDGKMTLERTISPIEGCSGQH